jgi:hypothetical protein
MDGGAANVEQEACDVPKDHVLLLCHPGIEPRAEDEVVEFKDRIGQPLAIERGIAAEAGESGVEQVECHRPFDIGWIDQHQPAVERSAGSEDS